VSRLFPFRFSRRFLGWSFLLLVLIGLAFLLNAILSPQPRLTIPLQSRRATAQFTADGNVLVVDRGSFQTWDPRSGRQLASYFSDGEKIRQWPLSPSARLLAAVDAEKRLHLINLATGPKWKTPLEKWDDQKFLSFSPKEDLLFVGDADQVLETATGKVLPSLPKIGEGEAFLWLTPARLDEGTFGKQPWSADLFFTAGHGIRAWKRQTGKSVGHLENAQPWLLSPDGRTLLATRPWKVSPDGLFHLPTSPDQFLLWDLVTFQVRPLTPSPKVTNSAEVLFSPDGRTLVFFRIYERQRGKVEFWDVASRKRRGGDVKDRPHAFLRSHFTPAFSPDSSLFVLAYNEDNPHIMVWDLAAAQALWEKPWAISGRGPGDLWPGLPRFTADGRNLLAPDETIALHLLDARTGEERATMRRMIPQVITPDSRFGVWQTQEIRQPLFFEKWLEKWWPRDPNQFLGLVRVLNLESAQELARLNHPDLAEGTRLSDDGQVLLTTHLEEDGRHTVRCWTIPPRPSALLVYGIPAAFGLLVVFLVQRRRRQVPVVSVETASPVAPSTSSWRKRLAFGTLVFLALIGLGTLLYNWLPPQPRWTVPYEGMAEFLGDDGSSILTKGMNNGPVRILDADSGQVRATLFEKLAENPDWVSSPGRRFLAARGGGKLQVADLQTGRSYQFVNPDGREDAFSPKGNYLAVADSQKIEVIEVTSGKVLKTFQSDFSDFGENGANPAWLAFTPDENWFLCRTKTPVKLFPLPQVQRWNTRTGQEKSLPSIEPIRLSPDGRTLLGRDHRQGIRDWIFVDLETGKTWPLKEVKGALEEGGRDTVQALFSPDGRTLITIPNGQIHNDAHVEFWEVATGKVRARGGEVRWDRHGNNGGPTPPGATFSPDGNYFVCRCLEWGPLAARPYLALWDVPSARLLWTTKDGLVHALNPNEFARFTADSRFLVLITEELQNERLKVLEAKTGLERISISVEQINGPVAGEGFIADFALTRNGGFVATQNHKVVKVIEISSGKEMARVTGSLSALSEDGATLLITNSGQLTCWSLPLRPSLKLVAGLPLGAGLLFLLASWWYLRRRGRKPKAS
jgi:WD40 repeat protein